MKLITNFIKHFEMGNCLHLSGWALNAVTFAFIRGRQREVALHTEVEVL